MDIFILPSILPDPFPTVILEAMAAEKPVVATAHGGALEMIASGKTGFHIPHNSAKEAAGVLEKLISDKGLIKRMGKEARKRVLKKFSLSAYDKKILDIFFDK
jgi:glycosyltransferase involved in cell wall biosynthesis